MNDSSLDNEDRKDGEKKSLAREIVDIVVYIGAIWLISFLFITFIAQRTDVVGNSMYPTLQDGNSLLVNKIGYRFDEPERFDIVIFPYQYGNHEFFIKRVIGLPGETVQIDYDGNIFINGQLLEENYGAEQILDPGRAAEPITLGEDEYFVMGDNRNNSMDSREPSVGNINKKDIIGKAFIRLFPFSEFGVLHK